MLPAAPPEATGEGVGTLYLQLALSLILLAFFIALTARMTLDPGRTGAILESVGHAFGQSDGPGAGVAESPAARATVKRLLALGDRLRTDLGLAEVDVTGSGHLLEVVLPEDAVFEPGVIAVRPAALNTLLPPVAEVLATPGEEVTVHCDLRLYDSDMATGRPGGVAVLRAGVAIRRLLDLGAPAASLTMGLDGARPGTVRLLFSVQDRAGRPIPLSRAPLAPAPGAFGP